jgi:hypothetical protein
VQADRGLEILVPSAMGDQMGMKPLSNHEIVVLALYALGGESSYVDTEDIAVKANDLAPGRFAWKKYPGQIHLEHVRVFLADARKEKNGRLVGGSNRTGWVLSDRGRALAKRRAPGLGVTDLSRAPVTKRERLWRARERTRIEELLERHAITLENCALVPKRDAEAVFRLDDYIAGEARARIVYRYVNAFGDDAAFGVVIKALARRVREDESHE